MSPFKWDKLIGLDSIPILTYKTSEVARLQERAPGEWLATLRYPGREPVTRLCTSLDTGRTGVEQWAARHQDAICGAIDADLAAFRRSVPGRKD